MAQRKSRQRESEPDPMDTTTRARRAAQAMHEQHDSKETTKVARTTFMRRFERIVDPAMTMLPATRELLAEQAKYNYFSAMGKRSAEKRRAQKEAATRQPIV